jgi:YD repeat-containing protein
MKAYDALAVVFLALCFSSPAQGQACYTPIASFQADYTMTGTGSGKDLFGEYSWTINHQMKGSPDMPGGGSCTTLGFGGTDATASGTADDHGTAKCGNNTPDNLDITGGVNFLSAATLSIDVSGGTYWFFPAVNVNATFTSDLCGSVSSSTSLLPLSPINLACTDVDPNIPKFTLPLTVQSLIQSGAHFGGAADCAYGIPSDWVLGFQLIPIYKVDKDCKKKAGSSVGCRNQSLGEDLGIVGTGFNLHYEGSRVAVAGGDSVASNDALMIGGWTLSVHHAFNPASQTLYLGDGSQRNGYQLGVPLTYMSNILITSEEGDEVYVFSPSGQHSQTVRPLTGAVLYQFGYNGAGNLVTVTDGNGNVTTIRRNSAGHATAIVSPYAQITTLTLDSNFFLSQVKDPLGKLVSFTNTAEGLIISRTDANGNTYNYTYDNASKLIKDADPVGGYHALTRTNAATGVGWTVAHATAMGQSSSFQSTVQLPWVQGANANFSQQQTNVWPDGLQATTSNLLQNGQLVESLALPDGDSQSQTSGPDPIWGLQVPVITAATLTKGTLTMLTTGSRATTLPSAIPLASRRKPTPRPSTDASTPPALPDPISPMCIQVQSSEAPRLGLIRKNALPARRSLG